MESFKTPVRTEHCIDSYLITEQLNLNGRQKPLHFNPNFSNLRKIVIVALHQAKVANKCFYLASSYVMLHVNKRKAYEESCRKYYDMVAV